MDNLNNFIEEDIVFRIKALDLRLVQLRKSIIFIFPQEIIMHVVKLNDAEN